MLDVTPAESAHTRESQCRCEREREEKKINNNRAGDGSSFVAFIKARSRILACKKRSEWKWKVEISENSYTPVRLSWVHCYLYEHRIKDSSYFFFFRCWKLSSRDFFTVFLLSSTLLYIGSFCSGAAARTTTHIHTQDDGRHSVRAADSLPKKTQKRIYDKEDILCSKNRSFASSRWSNGRPDGEPEQSNCALFSIKL